MKYSINIQKAIKFAAKTHHVYQDQKRKGKNIPYITHPLTVALILSLAGASEDVVIAGILHDTIEDSTDEMKVTSLMLEERFGKNVAELVLSVSENDKSLSWEERKKEALEHMKNFSQDSVLIKSADIISNNTELIDDYMRYGDEIFKRFHASKEKIINHYLNSIEGLLSIWHENPLAQDLIIIRKELEKIS